MATAADTEKTIFRTFRAEVKEVDAQAGIINMVIPMSTGAVDRDEEIIDPAAFKKTLKEFMKRPILLSSHMYSDLRKQIGEFKGLKVADEGLMAEGLEYYIGRGNDEADWGFYLASKGMAAYSVGFIPIKWEPIDPDIEETFMYGNRRYTEVELLEVSQVVVPSNREAIQGVRGKAKNDPILTALLNEAEHAIDEAETKVTKPEETDDYFRIPVKEEEGKHDGHKIKTITVSKDKGIKALYCGDCKVIITYLFSKDDEYGWTMASAETWVEDHSKSIRWSFPCDGLIWRDSELRYYLNPDKHDSFSLLDGSIPKELPEPRAISQGELRDDLDYIDKTIAAVGLSEQTATEAVDVAIRMLGRAWPYHHWDSITLGEYLTGQAEPVIFQRSTGNDIPDNIVSKVGAVLNAKNKGRLNQIRQLAQEVLDTAGTEEDGDDKQAEIPEQKVDPVEQAKQRVTDIAEVTNLVIAKLKGQKNTLKRRSFRWE